MRPKGRSFAQLCQAYPPAVGAGLKFHSANAVPGDETGADIEREWGVSSRFGELTRPDKAQVQCVYKADNGSIYLFSQQLASQLGATVDPPAQ
jgi:hypothetical protein